MDSFHILPDVQFPVAALVTLASALIQGFTGFGGVLLIIPVLAVIHGPLEATAIGALSGFAGNILLFRGATRSANWREVLPASVALAVTIPLAMMFLVRADPHVVRKSMGVFVVCAAFALASGWRFEGPRNRFTSATAGVLTGAVTGGLGVPGAPIMILYFLSSGQLPEIKRAGIIVTVTAGLVLLLTGLWMNGVYTSNVAGTAIALVPVYLLGTYIGRRMFQRYSGAAYQPAAYLAFLLSGLIALVF